MMLPYGGIRHDVLLNSTSGIARMLYETINNHHRHITQLTARYTPLSGTGLHDRLGLVLFDSPITQAYIHARDGREGQSTLMVECDDARAFSHIQPVPSLPWPAMSCTWGGKTQGGPHVMKTSKDYMIASSINIIAISSRRGAGHGSESTSTSMLAVLSRSEHPQYRCAFPPIARPSRHDAVTPRSRRFKSGFGVAGWLAGSQGS